jgi:tRNA U55 pseudouridine synthase TruB
MRLPVLSVRCAVSSGTYVRSLAHEAAAAAGCGGLAWSITRVAVCDASLSLLSAFPLRPVSASVFRAVMALLRARGYV